MEKRDSLRGDQNRPQKTQTKKPLAYIFTRNGAVPFYGKGGEVATNRLEDQELSVLALHLLQISLVYVNTLMIQQVLKEPEWFDRMQTEDFRALTPLIYSHVNPYGTFELDMDTRLQIETQ